MKTVHLIRYYNDSDVTLGTLHIEGINHKPIYTLENPWKNNERNISCIPVGEYKCELFSGVKHKNCFQVCDVKDREYILFHVGNYEKDTNGCILVGNGVYLNGLEYMIVNSQSTMRKFRELLENDSFELSISNSLYIGD